MRGSANDLVVLTAIGTGAAFGIGGLIAAIQLAEMGSAMIDLPFVHAEASNLAIPVVVVSMSAALLTLQFALRAYVRLNPPAN